MSDAPADSDVTQLPRERPHLMQSSKFLPGRQAQNPMPTINGRQPKR